jgi:hypothetical protein
MLPKTMTALAFAAACLTAAATVPTAHAQYAAGDQVVTNGPQSSGFERSGGWSAQQNIKQSERYSHLVQTNHAFRAQRMRTECGPITDADLHARCVQSFNQDQGGASVGSSTGPQNYSTGNGR